MRPRISKSKKLKDRRKSISCPYCRVKMVCMNRAFIVSDSKFFTIWYVCPRRKNEDGCGHASPVKILKSGRPERFA